MSNFRSLNDLKKKEEEDAKRNEYFAGGLDQRGGGSGLAVVGPPSNPNRDRNDLIDSIVQKASSQGAEGSPSSREGAQSIEITLYRNGFTVNDGPLRDLTSPENREFLSSLERSEIPRELLRTYPNPIDALDVHLKNKRAEDYSLPPAPAYVAFSGQASMLGSGVSGGLIFTSALLSQVNLEGSTTDPSTTIQVRTHDNKKLRIKVSTNASVLQLAAIIWRDTGMPSDILFGLSGGYPPKDLSEADNLIGASGLAGSSITQKKH